jgi:oligopeptide transport system substrate-binding protein
MRLRLCLVLLVLSSLVSLSGCAHHAQNGPSGNTLRVAMNAVPTTFDPAMAEDGNTIDLLQQVFEGLVQWTPKNTLAPALATKWDISNGGRTYTFHLRPNVKFQDGTSLTAQDVYFSLRRTLDPGLASPVAGYLSAIVGADAVAAGRATDLTGVRVIDPLTVAITLTAPRPYWIYTLTYPTDYILSPQEAKQNQVLTSDEVGAGAGTGPFRLTRYDTGARVLLAANPAYWGGAPKIAGQIRPIVIDAGARRNLYLTGQLDLVDEQKDALDADLKDPARRNQVQYFPRAETFYLGLNGHVFKPFADPRVRQALAYATDKNKICTVAFQNRLDVAQDILSEGIPGWDTHFKGISYDPAKARALLAQAGYPGGKGLPPIPLTYQEGHPDYALVVDQIRQMWQQNLGVTVQPQSTEEATLLNLEHHNALGCFFNSWTADYLDPQDYYSLLLSTQGGENHTQYSNPQFDALCAAADVSQDPKARMALYRQAAVIVARDVPMIPLYYQKDIELVQPYVNHLNDCLMGHLPYKNLTLK